MPLGIKKDIKIKLGTLYLLFPVQLETAVKYKIDKNKNKNNFNEFFSL